MEFKNYNHLKNYCFKIAYNKGYNISEEERSIFNNFEEIKNLLSKLEELNILIIHGHIDYRICLYFRCEKFDAIFSHMKYLIRKLKKFYNKEMNFYYIVTSLNSLLGLEIEFNEEFILNEASQSNMFYPGRISVLEIKESEEKIHTLSNYDANYKNRFGVYFIYDSKEELVYIGKSSTCLLSRCLESARERKTLDFSKLELRECKTRSDVAIYEAYYIGLYKPKYNIDLAFDDDPTMQLDELEVSKVIARDSKSEYYTFEYTYYRECTIDTEEFLNLLDTEYVYLNTPQNKEMLHQNNIYDKYEMRNKAHEVCIDKIKQEGKYATSELKYI